MLWIYAALLLDFAAAMAAYDGQVRLAIFVAVCSVPCWRCAWEEGHVQKRR